MKGMYSNWLHAEGAATCERVLHHYVITHLDVFCLFCKFDCLLLQADKEHMHQALKLTYYKLMIPGPLTEIVSLDTCIVIHRGVPPVHASCYMKIYNFFLHIYIAVYCNHLHLWVLWF